MRKKVAKGLGRAARAVGKNKGKAGLAVAGAALVAGAVVLAKKHRARRARNDGSGDLASSSDEQANSTVADSAEAALHIPVMREPDAERMTEAPVAGGRFNHVREDRKTARE